ncbi:hypothetical protein D3C75_747530 [compost metagenome]
MAGQLHLTDHFDLRVECRVPAMRLPGENGVVFWRVGCAPEHTIDSQQGQAAPVRMWRGVMPELRGLREHAADGVATQPLTGLDHGAGRDEGTVAWQHDVQAIHDLMEGFFTFKCHADNTPDHHFQRQATLAQGDGPGFGQTAGNQFRVQIITQGSQWVTQIIVTGYQIKSLSNVHKKIRKRVSISGFLHSHWIDQPILN